MWLRSSKKKEPGNVNSCTDTKWTLRVCVWILLRACVRLLCENHVEKKCDHHTSQNKKPKTLKFCTPTEWTMRVCTCVLLTLSVCVCTFVMGQAIENPHRKVIPYTTNKNHRQTQMCGLTYMFVSVYVWPVIAQRGRILKTWHFAHILTGLGGLKLSIIT